jgi:hypothetical protein
VLMLSRALAATAGQASDRSWVTPRWIVAMVLGCTERSR